MVHKSSHATAWGLGYGAGMQTVSRGVPGPIIIAFVLCGCAGPTAAQAEPQESWADFMPAQATGARQWVKNNPDLDGRGVIVAVLDTGVDPRASGLAKTSDGKVKVIEARDFSGQGDVQVSAAEVIKSGARLQVQHGELSVLGYETLVDAVDQKPFIGRFLEQQIAPSRSWPPSPGFGSPTSMPSRRSGRFGWVGGSSQLHPKIERVKQLTRMRVCR